MSTSLQKVDIYFETHLFSALFNIDYLPEIIYLIDSLHEIVTFLQAFVLLERRKNFLNQNSSVYSNL